MDLTKAVKGDKFTTNNGEIITYDIKSDNNKYPHLLIDSSGNSTSRTDDGEFNVTTHNKGLDIASKVEEIDLSKAVKGDKFILRNGDEVVYERFISGFTYPHEIYHTKLRDTHLHTNEGLLDLDELDDLDIVKAVKEIPFPIWYEQAEDSVRAKMSYSTPIKNSMDIEIQDIATIENLHDRLLSINGLNFKDPIMIRSRELTARMSNVLSPTAEGDATNSSADKINNKIDEVRDMLLAKNKAYGDAALAPVGIFNKNTSSDSIRARIDDKLARIKNSGINDDTEDTVQDLCGYFILLMIANDQ